MTNEKSKAEKKVVVESVAKGVAELDPSGNLQKAIDAGIVSAAVEEVEIDGGKFSGDYIKLTPGEKVVDDETFVEFAKAISGGNLFAPTAEDSDEPDTRAPHAVKFLVYGADLAARSRTSQRIKSAAEGPEKSIERMAKELSAKKGMPLDQAREMVRALWAD